MFFRACVVLFFTALTSSALAQEPATCIASLPVNVLDSEESPVSGLATDSFRVHSGRREIKILKASYSIMTPRVVLVLNLSSSVTGRAREFVQAAAQTFISLSSSRIPIGLVVFSGSGVQSFEFETQRDKLEEQLRRVMESPETGKGRATIYDAIMVASNFFRSSEAGDAIYLISNAHDSSSKSSPGGVRETLVRQHTRLYVFLVSYARIPTNEEYVTTYDLSGLADNLGGALLTQVLSDNSSQTQDWTPQELQTQTERLINRANGFYSLELELPVENKKKFGIAVSVRGGSHVSKVIFPREAACD